MAPTFGNGKICYLEIPAEDIAASAGFYSAAFGWQIRENSDGHTAFDDGVGEVSGMWVTDRPPHDQLGLLVSIMVFDIQACVEKVLTLGGRVLVQPDLSSPYPLARFSDPYGNIFGLYQHRVRD